MDKESLDALVKGKDKKARLTVANRSLYKEHLDVLAKDKYIAVREKGVV